MVTSHQEEESEFTRIREVYIGMALDAKYRPAAPGDGLGNIELNAKELEDPEILEREAERYAHAFMREEDSQHFHIGVSNWETNQALVLVIEAARLLCATEDQLAFKLLKLAMEKLKPQPIRRGLGRRV